MTPKEFELAMAEIYGATLVDGEWAVGNYDEENAHADADSLMEDTLKELGYGRGIEILEKVLRWYA